MEKLSFSEYSTIRDYEENFFHIEQTLKPFGIDADKYLLWLMEDTRNVYMPAEIMKKELKEGVTDWIRHPFSAANRAERQAGREAWQTANKAYEGQYEKGTKVMQAFRHWLLAKDRSGDEQPGPEWQWAVELDKKLGNIFAKVTGGDQGIPISDYGTVRGTGPNAPQTPEDALNLLKQYVDRIRQIAPEYLNAKKTNDPNYQVPEVATGKPLTDLMIQAVKEYNEYDPEKPNKEQVDVTGRTAGRKAYNAQQAQKLAQQSGYAQQPTQQQQPQSTQQPNTQPAQPNQQQPTPQPGVDLNDPRVKKILGDVKARLYKAMQGLLPQIKQQLAQMGTTSS